MYIYAKHPLQRESELNSYLLCFGQNKKNVNKPRKKL